MQCFETKGCFCFQNTWKVSPTKKGKKTVSGQKKCPWEESSKHQSNCSQKGEIFFWGGGLNPISWRKKGQTDLKIFRHLNRRICPGLCLLKFNKLDSGKSSCPFSPGLYCCSYVLERSLQTNATKLG